MRGVERMQDSDLSEVAALDACIFGADRAAVWGYLFATYRARSFITRNGQGHINGYIISQSRRIGPWAAEKPGDADALLQTALTLGFGNDPVILVPEANPVALELVAQSGFRHNRTLRHMRRGSARGIGRSVEYYSLVSFSMG